MKLKIVTFIVLSRNDNEMMLQDLVNSVEYKLIEEDEMKLVKRVRYILIHMKLVHYTFFILENIKISIVHKLKYKISCLIRH